MSWKCRDKSVMKITVIGYVQIIYLHLKCTNSPTTSKLQARTALFVTECFSSLKSSLRNFQPSCACRNDRQIRRDRSKKRKRSYL
jgi:hypothetical protein